PRRPRSRRVLRFASRTRRSPRSKRRWRHAGRRQIAEQSRAAIVRSGCLSGYCRELGLARWRTRAPRILQSFAFLTLGVQPSRQDAIGQDLEALTVSQAKSDGFSRASYRDLLVAAVGRGLFADLDTSSAEVHDDVLRNTGAGVERKLRLSVVGKRRIRNL